MKQNVVGEIKTNKYHVRYLEELRQIARNNRRNETVAENIMWNQVLRGKKTGYKFTRQKPLGRFIADFYCAELSLIIEIDGESHIKKQELDRERDNYLLYCGIRTIRYMNDEVLRDINKIKEDLKFKLL